MTSVPTRGARLNGKEKVVYGSTETWTCWCLAVTPVYVPNFGCEKHWGLGFPELPVCPTTYSGFRVCFKMYEIFASPLRFPCKLWSLTDIAFSIFHQEKTKIACYWFIDKLVYTLANLIKIHIIIAKTLFILHFSQCSRYTYTVNIASKCIQNSIDIALKWHVFNISSGD